MDFLSSDIAVTPLAKVLEVNDGRQCLAVSEPIQISWPSVESNAEQRTEQGTRSSGRFYPSRFFFFLAQLNGILFCACTFVSPPRNKEQEDNFSSTISLYPPAESLALFAHGNSASSLGGSFFLAGKDPVRLFSHTFPGRWRVLCLSKQEKNGSKSGSGLEPALHLPWRIRAEKSYFLGEGSKREEVTGSVDHKLLTTF